MLETTLADLSYAPLVLLPARLSPVIVSDAEYQGACAFGYFECSYVARTCSTWEELRAEIVRDVLVAHEQDKTSLVICAGVVLGYLSAFALVNHALALRGVELLELFINSYGVPSAAGFLGGATC